MLAHLVPVLLMLAPAAAHAQASVDDFALGGSAARLDEECIRLTPDQQYLSGSAWYRQPIDLSVPFEMRMNLVLGDKDDSGADGIVFVFHPTMQTGFRGEGMGFAGLQPSLGIEFDTYRNDHLADPELDHVAIMTNGRLRHTGRTLEIGDLEDGERHPLRIEWDPRKELVVFLDQVKRAAYPAASVRALFGSTTSVYWGVTAATGRLSNAQDVCIEKLFMGV